MFDFIINDDDSDRALLIQLMKRMHEMALDLAKLNAAVDRSTAVSEKLLAAHAAAQPDPAVELALQGALDAVAGKLDVESAKAEAVLPVSPFAEPTPAA